MKIKIFEGGTVRQELAKLLKAGYVPATFEQTCNLIKSEKIPNTWYSVLGTIAYERRIRRPTLKELKNIEDMYEKGMRAFVLVDGDGGRSFLLGGRLLDYGFARLVGVKK